MKQFLILTVLFFTSFFATAQNGGQFFQNNVIRIEYLGYSNGVHKFKVVNKQNCEVRIRTKADTDAAIDINVAANDSSYVNVSRPNPTNVKFRVKAETSCPSFTNPDMGWLELNTSNFSLPLSEEYSPPVIIRPTGLNVYMDGGLLKSKHSVSNYLMYIKVFDMSGILKYRDDIFVRKPTHQIDLTNYLRFGMNFIEVVIETRGQYRFSFRYIK